MGSSTMRTASRLVVGAPVGEAFIATGGYSQNSGAERLRFLRNAGLVGLQLVGLWGFNIAGGLGVKALALPIPGNLAGMILLYALLSLGIIKVSWLDATGSFLVKHLAFFFIPVAVGVMDAGGLLAAHGIGITLTLLISAILGIALSGLVAQSLASRSVHGQGELR